MIMPAWAGTATRSEVIGLRLADDGNYPSTDLLSGSGCADLLKAAEPVQLRHAGTQNLSGIAGGNGERVARKFSKIGLDYPIPLWHNWDMENNHPALGKESFRRDVICTKCGKSKRPTRAYLTLLKCYNLSYVCQACRESAPPPPIRLGKLGII